MKTRATLTIDPELHGRAKRLAKQRRTTVSGLFESFLAQQPDPSGSKVDSLIGCSRLKKESKPRDAKRDYLESKYLR
jgi:hypothetical protein